jgi:hypothetical protein
LSLSTIRIPHAKPAMPMDISYPPPVDQLLSLGHPDDRERDYRALGFSEEHLPVLLELMEDERLSWDAWKEGDDDGPFWGPLHAWRALGQVFPEQAVDPLLAHLVRNQENDWAMEEIPEILGMIGAPALVPVADALARAKTEPESALVPVLAEALKNIAQRHPPLRGRAVGLLIEQLIEWSEQSAEVNAWLIASLLDLQATEAIPLIQAAFAADAVAEDIVGDWEEAQVDLGLIEARTTPRPQYLHSLTRGQDPDFAPAARGGQRSDKAAAKAKNRRKAEKQSRKRNRKRK